MQALDHSVQGHPPCPPATGGQVSAFPLQPHQVLSPMSGSSQMTSFDPGPHSNDQVSDLQNERVAHHALNKEKLLRGLVKDAHGDKPDIECEVNNFGGNVNLHCNSGFFLAVVKPAFLNLNAGSPFVVQGITVSMPGKPTTTKDTTGFNEKILFKFSISTATVPVCILGNAAVHLHLTTRLIQVQGGQRMPDTSPIATWFSDNVVIPLLKGQASLTKVDRSIIDSINSAILSTQGSTQNKSQKKTLPTNSKHCGGCKKAFESRSNIVPCPACAKFYHKAHFKDHVCSGSTLASPNTTTMVRSLQTTMISCNFPPRNPDHISSNLSLYCCLLYKPFFDLQ